MDINIILCFKMFGSEFGLLCSIRQDSIFGSHPALLAQISFALGFGLGNFAWLTIIVKVLDYYKTRLSGHTLAKIHRFAGFTLIGFGTILSYHIYTVTKWPAIFRLIFAF